MMELFFIFSAVGILKVKIGDPEKYMCQSFFSSALLAGPVKTPGGVFNRKKNKTNPVFFKAREKKQARALRGRRPLTHWPQVSGPNRTRASGSAAAEESGHARIFPNAPISAPK